MKKRQLFFCLFVGLLLVGLIAKFVDMEGLISYKRDGKFLNSIDLKKDYPIGSEEGGLETLILSEGYKIISCGNADSLDEGKEKRCFYKKRCFDGGGFTAGWIHVFLDNNKKISGIDGGWGTTFHAKCPNIDETVGK
ncbi:MAG: hypothetical protein JNM12_12985 [Alphaproteobacteria bacterium]|nr:hypothetical protein [Alphaproteobacteria bacterium]